MTAALKWQRVSPDEYLAAERAAPYKSEYLGGYVVATPPANRWHNILTTHLAAQFNSQLLSTPGEVYISQMRVKVSATGDYTYPDVAVACGDIEFEDGELDTLLTPTTLIEVLSPSTERYDRGSKFESYRQIASLREYIMVAQDRVLVEQYVRQGDGWLLTTHDDPEGSVYLPSINCTLALKDVYRKVRFPAQRLPARDA
jgi:Uma2 family endonuclease